MKIQSNRIQKTIYALRNYYSICQRELPWRKKTNNPYHVLVSEVMLQQTQVDRVIPKFKIFITTFPTIQTLANATPASILRVWSGLGYNRRALALGSAARCIVSEYNGKIPRDRNLLQKLPGIGTYTSGAICAFAYNKGEVFVETNIRTVVAHHIYPQHRCISEEMIHDAVCVMLSYAKKKRIQPNTFYSALMDYGAHLKETGISVAHRVAVSTKQKKFSGSVRQARGLIVRTLLEEPHGLSKKAFIKRVTHQKRTSALCALMKDGIVVCEGNTYTLTPTL